MLKSVDIRRNLNAALFRVRQFFVKFLPRLKPNELYWDGPFPDHVFCQPQDALRFPHIEQVNAGLIQAVNSYDQPDGIGNAHHVAGNIGMSDRERATVIYLGLKLRDHTPGRPHHIPEADYNPFVFIDDEFTYPLSEAHYATGGYGLIGADEYIFATASTDGIQRP